MEKIQQHQETCDLIEYKKARNAAIASLRKAHRKFKKKLACNIKNDSKTFYRYVMSKSRTKDIIGPLKDDRGNIVTDDGQMADILNNFFSSVFTKEKRRYAGSENEI